MQIDFTASAAGIGTLVAAAEHDFKTADPADVGLNGVPIRMWREAYLLGCKDMANKVTGALPEEIYGEIKKAVVAAYNAERGRLAPEGAPLTSQNREG